MKMTNFDFNLIDKHNQSKILKGSIIPRPIAWITSENKLGVVNLAPFSYFNIASSSLITVSFQRKGYNKKDTANNILYNKEAVINIASQALINELDMTSKEIDSDISEISLTSLNLIKSTKVNVPGIKEAPIRLEVKLVDHIKLYNYNNTLVEADLLILRVIHASIDNNIIDLNNNYILHDKLNPISRLGGPYYASINEMKDFKRKY